jgi:hypothetical protein
MHINATKRLTFTYSVSILKYGLHCKCKEKYIMSNVHKLVIRKDIIENLIKEKIELGLKPEMVFKHYETEGLIPKAKSKGMGQGKGRQAVYPEYVHNMVKMIRQLQSSGKKIAAIKEIIIKKYKWAFHLEDLDMLKTLRFPDQQIIDNYCNHWGIDESGKKGTVQT